MHMRLEFDFNVHNMRYDGYMLTLMDCVWIWVGIRNISSLGLSHYPVSSMLIDTPNTQSVCIKAITTQIAKCFKGKQVFFSSDIDNEDPKFWQDLFTILQPHFAKIIDSSA